MKNSIKILSVLLLVFFAGCKKDDSSPGDATSQIGHEEELITSVLLIHYDSLKNVLDTAVYKDTDGIGGRSPTIDTLRLSRNSIYAVNIKFLDESNPSAIKDITMEIKEEGDEHLVCYQLFDASGVFMEIVDSDGLLPIGLESRWKIDSTAQSSNGQLQLLLKHQPEFKDGSCGPGDTDVEVFFPIIFL